MCYILSFSSGYKTHRAPFSRVKTETKLITGSNVVVFFDMRNFVA